MAIHKNGYTQIWVYINMGIYINIGTHKNGYK